MFELHPASQAALDEFCRSLTDDQADYLRGVVERVCADPSGNREPKHRYTRPFPNASKYAPGIPSGAKAWELKTNRYRGLFITDEIGESDKTRRVLIFLPVKGKRFFTVSDAPWPH